tara:strand:- start:9750 stop:10046 length:297 start_codon:yes stop_codon:yes gene_type:complete
MAPTGPNIIGVIPHCIVHQLGCEIPCDQHPPGQLPNLRKSQFIHRIVMPTIAIPRKLAKVTNRVISNVNALLNDSADGIWESWAGHSIKNHLVDGNMG